MDLPEFLGVLRRFWRLIAATTVLGVVAGTVLVFVTGTSYTANATIYFSASGGKSGQDLAYSLTYAQGRMQSVQSLVGTPSVLQPVIDSLHLDTSVAALSGDVAASTSQINTLMTISATDASPQRAAAIANATAQGLIRVVSSLERPTGAAAASLRGTVVTPATAPAAPSHPNVPLDVIGCTVLGLVLGLLLALLWHLIAAAGRTERERAANAGPAT